MEFGKNYSYVKPAKLVDAGIYTIILGKPHLAMCGTYQVLRFPFSYEGMSGEFTPNYFDLFDCYDPSDAKALMNFRKNASRIKRCFLLGGEFSENSYEQWEGSRGQVEIAKNEKGFLQIVRFFDHERADDYETYF